MGRDNDDADEVPTELVQAIMPVYDGAKAGLRDKNGVVLDKNTFGLSFGNTRRYFCSILVYYSDGLCSEVIHD